MGRVLRVFRGIPHLLVASYYCDRLLDREGTHCHSYDIYWGIFEDDQDQVNVVRQRYSVYCLPST